MMKWTKGKRPRTPAASEAAAFRRRLAPARILSRPPRTGRASSRLAGAAGAAATAPSAP